MTIQEIQKALEESFSNQEEKLMGALDEKVAAAVKAQAATIEKPTNPIIKTFDERGRMTSEAKVKIVDFFKKVYSRDYSGLKAMNEGSGSSGGFLVPEEFRIEIQRIMEECGLVRAFAKKWPMKRDKLSVPTLATSVIVYWPGEGNAGTQSQPVLGNVELNSETMVGLTVMTEELLEDADTDVVNNLAELFAEAFACEEDKQGLVGTGTPFSGVLNDANVNLVTMATGKDTFAEADLDDYRDLITKVKASVLPNSAFYMHREVWALVQKLKENSQHVVSFQNPIVPMGNPPSEGQGPKIHGYLWGYPVYLSDQMPSVSAVSTRFVIFGSLQKGLFFGDRKQMTVKMSDSATVGSNNVFEENSQAVRFTERIALVVALPKAFSVLKTAAA